MDKVTLTIDEVISHKVTIEMTDKELSEMEDMTIDELNGFIRGKLGTDSQSTTYYDNADYDRN